MTTLFGTPEVEPRRKYSLLPVLVVLFLLSYGLMTLLIVEQGNTIESQRSVIKQMVGDSAELSALKSKTAQPPTAEAAQTRAQADESQKNSPVPSPSTQATPAEKASPTHKAQRPMPPLPPVPASDIADERRSLMSI